MVQSGAAASQRAENELRAAIQRGDLVPGQRLIEEELADRFGVTRSSLRQAIDRLAADGIAQRVPNRGARVRQLELAEAVEITECRMVLEGLLARKAAERCDAAAAARLHQQLGAMRRALAAGDPLKYSGLISELYDLVHRLAAHCSAAALVDRLQAQLVRHQFQLSLRPGRSRVSMREMTAVVEAIVARRPGTAERVMRAHLRSVVDELMGAGRTEGAS